MLFPVESRLQNVRLIGTQLTTTVTPSFTSDLNGDEFVAPSRSGVGTFTLPLRQGSSRLLQMFGTPNTSDTNLNVGTVNSTSVAGEKSSVSGSIVGTGGTLRDSTADIIIASATSAVTDRVKKNPVLGCKRQGGVLIFGDITITGGAATINKGSGDFTATRTGTGAVTIAFKRQIFGQAPVVLVQAITSNGWFGARVLNKTTSGFDLLLANNSGAANDRLNFIAYGFSAKDSYGGAEAPLMSTQRSMRLELYRIVGGALTLGSQLGTVSGGTGDYTVTFREPFRQKPFVFTGAANATARGCWQNVPTTGSVQSFNFSYPTTLANSTAQDILVIGSDDPSEY